MSTPKQVYRPEFVCWPHSATGPRSGAHVLAQFEESCLFRLAGRYGLDEDYVNANFYEPLEKDDEGYISFKDGVERLVQVLQNEQPCWSQTGLAVAWFDTLEMTKRYIHRCDVVMVEMLADASILNAGRNSLAGVFDISASKGVASSVLTKGFVACGYDETGVLV